MFQRYIVALDETGKPVIVERQSNWVFCSLSHEYVNFRDTTNHVAKKYDHLTGELREAFASLRQQLFDAIPEEMRHKAEAMSILVDSWAMKALQERSIAVEDLIAHLQTLKSGTRIVIQESGHYAESDAIEFKMRDLVEIDGVQYHTLGESQQFC